MAILNRLVKLPSDSECSILSELQRHFQIWQPGLIPGDTPQKFFLCEHEKEQAISIFSGAEDVQFKFECFYLNFEKVNVQKIDKRTKLGELENCRVSVVIRAEWESPASPNEVPACYEQVVQRRGKLSDFPKKSSGCVSVVGVLFMGENDSERGLIYLDDFPMKLGYTQEPKQIDDYLSECWTVAVDEVATLRHELNTWATISRE